jgi:hypothetical protein
LSTKESDKNYSAKKVINNLTKLSEEMVTSASAEVSTEDSTENEKPGI